MTRAEIAKLAPPSGRRSTLVGALELLHDAVPAGARIVEVGTSRNAMPIACHTDGWATRLFAWYAEQTGGHVVTIDNRRHALNAARRICGIWLSSVTFECADADLVLGGFDRIDLLYMDGPADAGAHLAMYGALRCMPRFVLWDDIVTMHEPVARWHKWPPPGVPAGCWQVKGALAIPAMLEDGYHVVFARDRQVLLKRSLNGG